MESAKEVQGSNMEEVTEALGSTLGVSEQYGRSDGGRDRPPCVASRETELEENFYDCRETLEDAEEKPASNSLGRLRTEQEEEGDANHPDRKWEKGGQDVHGEEEPVLLDRPDLSEEGRDRGIQPEQDSWVECSEDDQAAHSPQDGVEESEFGVKEEVVPEFDEEYLSELEKDLSQEEKESRREESLKLKETGNAQFKRGEHSEAEESYTAALRACPVCYGKERAILFSNRAAARLHLDKNEGAIADCSKAMELNPDYIRAILRRAELYEKTDKLDEALEDYKLVLEKDPSVKQAREATLRLPQQIHERNERLKEEMMGKLKDLGNMFLRPFGLSTSNFQVNQDPASGSYSINFVQNPNNNNR
ncbi:tetratricopeptide repeat protein 1 isoform X2 [Brienomyrus brachyistius]|uniref:tetratricopeptide repeat protein 1 isoform X2 n=1 Tax=Brienomyrus brachyistius TaxID=42636 RepID=UPI0020B431D9|nr:tetratricopeptide repeat protein 1 isoform X2 [Brienomyrus brachyistius]